MTQYVPTTSTTKPTPIPAHFTFRITSSKPRFCLLPLRGNCILLEILSDMNQFPLCNFCSLLLLVISTWSPAAFLAACQGRFFQSSYLAEELRCQSSQVWATNNTYLKRIVVLHVLLKKQSVLQKRPSSRKTFNSWPYQQCCTWIYWIYWNVQVVQRPRKIPLVSTMPLPNVN